LNVIFICKLLPLLDKNIFIDNFINICHICIIPVHSEMMKKLDSEDENRNTKNSSFNLMSRSYNNNPVVTNSTKSLYIRQSNRKKNLYDNDPVIKFDIHQLFVQSFKVNIKFI
jgi:hypothetical protein